MADKFDEYRLAFLIPEFCTKIQVLKKRKNIWRSRYRGSGPRWEEVQVHFKYQPMTVDRKLDDWNKIYAWMEFDKAC